MWKISHLILLYCLDMLLFESHVLTLFQMINMNSFIYYLIYYKLSTWKGWFKAIIFLNQHCDMLWSHESNVVADQQDDLLRLWRSTNSIKQSGTEQDVGFGFSGRSTIHGNSWKGEVASTTIQTSQHICCNWRWRDSSHLIEGFVTENQAQNKLEYQWAWYLYPVEN